MRITTLKEAKDACRIIDTLHSKLGGVCGCDESSEEGRAQRLSNIAWLRRSSSVDEGQGLARRPIDEVVLRVRGAKLTDPQRRWECNAGGSERQDRDDGGELHCQWNSA